MGNTTTDVRFTPLLAAEVRSVLERHGYRLPKESDHVHGLVMARVATELRNLVEVFEGRIR
ncbi:hypothetical protein [Nonomuraea gerenzanensis]|uniref:Uncharacterized protein n=1 Tax=Nonomuraea gerenzanensis TaxID=93944 RepID=A0A1M4EQZ4_9ACTN|nr:hypothetical protein [Nonomuraea gerenzanensis]UBU12695.1 hypothetical protein LCN96_51970 [Nonomuraea gerenzanensis]SBP01250.1 hypothetical protein BN4615_P10766 [Nonomuraea gerenzanensis]